MRLQLLFEDNLQEYAQENRARAEQHNVEVLVPIGVLIVVLLLVGKFRAVTVRLFLLARE